MYKLTVVSSLVKGFGLENVIGEALRLLSGPSTKQFFSLNITNK